MTVMTQLIDLKFSIAQSRARFCEGSKLSEAPPTALAQRTHVRSLNPLRLLQDNTINSQKPNH
jgi:hypothetical protein